MESYSFFEISETARNRAVKCFDCHACLEDPEFEICRVDFHFEDTSVILSNSNQCRKCGYGQPFAGGHICVCPVRQELYIRHGV